MRGGDIGAEDDGVGGIERQQIVEAFGVAAKSPVSDQFLNGGFGGCCVSLRNG